MKLPLLTLFRMTWLCALVATSSFWIGRWSNPTFKVPAPAVRYVIDIDYEHNSKTGKSSMCYYYDPKAIPNFYSEARP